MDDTGACGENATCDVNNHVCVPLRATLDDVGVQCNEEYPFWVAELCMSFPEASCYCLGEGAKLI
ncbi:MAG: hypothetical protein JXX29_22760, partial [Deltaproteobacteria bacterium]|nr:hypothetical protein [Deltaproteobacteria bacterium]MBN2674520.1 hypothetical protein [Deltaproteobacteria bacterium]